MIFVKNLFSLILKLKNRKITFFAVLFSVLPGIFLPLSAKAIPLIPVLAGYLALKSLGIGAEQVAGLIAHNIIGLIAIVFLIITWSISFITSTLLIWVVTSTTKGVSYTDPEKNPVIAAGWPIVRDFSNTFIVLMLIVIAVATILRFRDYEAKQLLPKLIIVALLINFSLLICGVVIDFSNIIMSKFLSVNSVDWFSTQEFNFTSTYESFEKDGTLIFVAKVIGEIFYLVMKMIISILFFFLFYFRVIALWILVLLSPLAFVSAVFPQTKAMIFDKWFKNFIQWCFIGVFGAIFLFLGTEIHNAIKNKRFTLFENVNFNQSTGDIALALSQAFSNLYVTMIPGIFLVIGFIFTLSLSAMGAGMAITAFKKSGNYLRSGASYLGREFSKRTGVKDAYDKTRIGGVRALEKVGLLRIGTTSSFRQEVMQDRLKKDTERLRYENNKTLVGQAVRGNAGAINLLKERKKLHLIGQDDNGNDLPNASKLRETAMRNLMKHDAKLTESDFAETNYQFAAHDSKTLKIVRPRIRRENPQRPGENKKDYATRINSLTEQAAMLQQLEEGLPSMSGKQTRENINPDHLTKEFIAKAFSVGTVRKLINAGTKFRKKVRSNEVINYIQNRIDTAPQRNEAKKEVDRLKNILREIKDLPGPTPPSPGRSPFPVAGGRVGGTGVQP